MNNKKNLLYKKWSNSANLNLNEISHASFDIDKILENDNLKNNYIDNIKNEDANDEKYNIQSDESNNKFIHNFCPKTINNIKKINSCKKWLNTTNYNLSNNDIKINEFEQTNLDAHCECRKFNIFSITKFYYWRYHYVLNYLFAICF